MRVRQRDWGGSGSDPRLLGCGEQRPRAALEALGLAEGGVLVLEAHVQAGVHRGQRAEEPDPVVHAVPLTEGYEPPGRVLGPGRDMMTDAGGRALRGIR